METESERTKLSSNIVDIVEKVNKSLSGGNEAIDNFREEFNKVKNSLIHSIQRQTQISNECKFLKDELKNKTHQLEAKVTYCHSLERQVRQLELEQELWRIREANWTQREQKTKDLVFELKQKVADLQKYIKINALSSKNNNIGKSEENETLKKETGAMDKPKQVGILSQYHSFVTATTIFDEWKESRGKWTPKGRRKPKLDTRRRPRTAYDLYSSQNKSIPHAHEITLAYYDSPMRIATRAATRQTQLRKQKKAA